MFTLKQTMLKSLRGILSNGNKDWFGFQIYWTKKASAASTCQYTFQVTWVGSTKGSD